MAILRGIHLILHMLLHIAKLLPDLLGGSENGYDQVKNHFINNINTQCEKYKT